MDGLGWLLKSMGVEVAPEEILKAVEVAKVLIPRIAAGFDEMNATLKRIEANQADIILSGRQRPLLSTSESPEIKLYG